MKLTSMHMLHVNKMVIKKHPDLFEVVFLSSYLQFVLSTLLPAYIDSRGIEPTFGLLKELGGWPVLGNNKGGNWSESQYDLTRLLLDLLRYNNKPLINLYVYTDSKNSTIRIIYVR